MYDKIFFNGYCSMEVESLGLLLGQTVVSLSPLIPDHPQAVAEIFKFLIIDNKLCGDGAGESHT